MVAKKVKKPIKRQNQKQLVNVNVKIDQSKKGASSRPKTIIQRVGPQIVMTSAGSYSFPQRTLESNTQYNQLASIMEKIVENERYKASRGNALEAVREQRISKLEANTQGNGLAKVKINNDIETMSTLTRDEEEEEDEVDVIVPQYLDPNMSVYGEDTVVSERSNPINKIKEKADKYEELVEEEEPKGYPYPTILPNDYRERYFNTETGRWNLNKNIRRQKAYLMKEMSDRHYNNKKM